MIFMSPPKMDSYQGSPMLCCLVLSTEGTIELIKFAKTCGFHHPIFSRQGRYDEHIKVSGRRIVGIVKEKGAVETPTLKNFRKILSDRKQK